MREYGVTAASSDAVGSVGTLSAFLCALYALFMGTAQEPGWRHGVLATVMLGKGASHIYLEAAAGVTLFVLAGRHLDVARQRARVHGHRTDACRGV